MSTDLDRTPPRVAAVTGASSGIGAAIARAFGRLGWTVALGARRTDRLEEVARQIRRDGGRPFARALDVTSAASVDAFFDAADAAVGTPDVVVNNAGVGVPGMLHEISVEATPDQLQALQAKINASKTSDEALALLRGANLQHELRHSSIAPESLPPALMDRITSAGRNKAIFLTAPGGAKVVYVVDVRPAPVTEAAAAPRIERYLVNERKRQLARQDMKNLRAGARIEYVGDFKAR